MIDFEIKTLDNGIRLVTAPNTSTEAVTVFILVGVGGRFEGDKQKGISHFLEHLFFKGSKNRPSTFEISKELDSIGANFNAFTGEECTGFYVQSESGDFEKAFDVISDMFLNPLFDATEIEREKGVILQEANMYRDMPQAFVQILNQKQIFGDHPLGFDLVGDQDHIKRISRDDIVGYQGSNYIGENTVMVVCGNPKDQKWDEAVRSKFEASSRGKAPAFEPFEGESVKNKLVEEIRKVDQTHLALSYIGLGKSDKRRYEMSVLNTLLGGGMSSRLFMEIRERKGLAYYVKSNHNAFLDTGIYSILAGVKPEALRQSVEIILGEVEDLKQNGPNEEELSRAKGNLRGSLAISLEDSLEIASFIADDLLSLGQVRKIEDIIDKIDTVSSSDIRNLAREVFTKDRMGLSIIGPKSYNNDLKELI